MIDALDAALKAFDAAYPAGLEELRTVVRAYVDFQREHIALEKRELIPVAHNHLEPADWGAIDRAFGTDSDPLFGENMETGFRALSKKITRYSENNVYRPEKSMTTVARVKVST